jgi:hypothetical protein
MSQVSAVPAERVFRRHPVRIAIGALVLSAVLSAAALFLIPPLLPRNMGISTRGQIVLVAVIVLIAAVWTGSFWLRNIRVVVRPETVEIGRPGGMQSYPRDTTAFRSKVTEHRTNGLRTGTTRALVVWTGGRESVIDLPGFRRTTFNELMAELAPIAQPAPVDPVAAARERAMLPTVFRLDVSLERRIGRGFLITGVVFLVAAVAGGSLALASDITESDFLPLILLSPLAAVIGVGFAIGAAQRYRAARSTPTQITIGHHGIRLDDVDHPYAQLTRIWLTPPAYPVHRIRLDRAAGRGVVRVLGSTRVTMTPSYQEFLQTLRSETAHLPGLVSLDLE